MKRDILFVILPLIQATSLFMNAVAQTPLDVLVNNRANNSIMKFDQNGNYLGNFVSNGSGGLSGPEDILFHPDGSIIVTGFNNNAIKRYDGVTGSYLGNFSSGYTLRFPSKMSIGPDNLIYVTQWDTMQNKVARFTLQGSFVDEFTTIGAPKGLGHVWDKDKNFYISLFNDGGNGTVHRFDSSGNDMGTFINSAILQGPTNIWLDSNGDMLVEDWTVGKVLRYDSAGLYKSTFVTGMNNPEGIAFMPDGSFLIGDWGIDAVHLVNANGTLSGYFCIGNNLADPNCIKIRTAITNSIHEVEYAGFRISPTVGRKFIITQPITFTQKTGITIINAFGQLIKKIEPGNTTVWDATTCPGGVYFIIASSSGKIATQKVLVQ